MAGRPPGRYTGDMNDESIHIPAWQHAFREQLAEAEGVPDAGAATLDPEVDAGLLDGVPAQELRDACASAEPDSPEARALTMEIERRERMS